MKKTIFNYALLIFIYFAKKNLICISNKEIIVKKRGSSWKFTSTVYLIKHMNVHVIPWNLLKWLIKGVLWMSNSSEKIK